MKKVLLFLSAFVPLYFLVTIKIIIDIINDNLHFNFLNTISLISFILLIGIGLFGAKISIDHKNTRTTSIKIIEYTSITEQYFLGYFSLFVLFALSFELEKVSMFIVFIIIIILIGLVYIRNDLFYINPLLNILGYNFYSVTFINLETNQKQNEIFIYYGKLSNKDPLFSAKLSHENFSLIEQKNKNWVLSNYQIYANILMRDFYIRSIYYEFKR